MTSIDGLERELASAREMLEAFPAIVVRTDRNLRIVDGGKLAVGLSRVDIVGRSLFDIVPAHLHPAVAKASAEVMRTGQPYRGIHVHGKTTLEVFTQPLSNGDILHVSFDVSREQAQTERLAHAEGSLRLAKVASGMGFWSFDSRTERVVWDENMFEMIGTEEALTPRQWLEYVIPEDRNTVSNMMEAAFRTGSMPMVAHRLRRPDGQLRWMLTVGEIHGTEDGSYEVHGCTIDITEQRRTEERLRESQRIEAVGQLAAGIAHNFNNLLAVIMPTLELARDEVGSELQPGVDEALTAAGRASELVRQLMTFARRRSSENGRADSVSAIVRRAVNLCRRVFGTVEIGFTEFQDDSNDPSVRGNIAELEQVIVNLLLNARDAVVAAGVAVPRIQVSLECVSGREVLMIPGLELREPIAAGYVRLSVEDNGTGMSEAVRSRLFEPFFTTKEPGRGTGLGVATARASVRDSGGDIGCSSSPGVGTRFDVYLPIDNGSENVEVAKPPQLRGAGQRVLLVDDEPAVRHTITVALERAGFWVASAESGTTAIAQAAAHPDLALVLLDRSMPGGMGTEFVAGLRTLLPHASILLFTGDDVNDDEAALVDGVIQKPVSAASLIRQIIHALDARPGRH